MSTAHDSITIDALARTIAVVVQHEVPDDAVDRKSVV